MRLFAAAASLRSQIGASRHWLRRSHEQDEAAVRDALPPAVFATAWASGGSFTVEEAIAEALADAEPPDPDMRRAESAAVADTGLTSRENEILRLLADGLTDREIAAMLSISPRTVNGHVTNLLGKLGVESRTAAATFAVRHGLA